MMVRLYVIIIIIIIISLYFTSGIEVKTTDGAMLAHAALLLATADLPAKAMMLNMKQYNGKYGCSNCDYEGVPRSSAKMIRDWPYCCDYVTRTHDSVIKNAKEAVKEKSVGSIYL